MTTILLLAVKSLLVAGATLLLLRWTRGRSAAERSTIAHLGLFAMIALPFASLALPELALSVPRLAIRVATPAEHERISLKVPRALMGSREVEQARSGSDTPALAGRALPMLVRFAYLAPVLALLLLTAFALLRLVGLRARADVLIDAEWVSALARAQRRMGFKSGTALLSSDELGSPVSWGLMRPTILLNEAAVLAPKQAEAIIAHELAHVVHLDWAKLILARVATAVFWFNPLAWLLAREAHQLREEAADDAVLAAKIAAPDYAELLIGVARHQCRGTLIGAHGVAPSKSSLARRVRRVLDKSPARGTSGRSWVAGFAMGMMCMSVPLAAVTIAPTKAASAPPGVTQAPALAATSERARSLVGSKHNVAAARETSTGEAIAVRALDPDVDSDRTDYAMVEADQDDAIVPPFAASRQVRATRRLAHRGRSVDVDALIGMRAVGVTAEYQRAMAEAGFPGLSAEQLTGARAVGLTPGYVWAMRAAGMRASLDDLIGARATGLDPDYVGSLRALGIEGSFDDFQGMRAVGVTAAFVRRLRSRGITTTSPEKLTTLRAVGFDRDP